MEEFEQLLNYIFNEEDLYAGITSKDEQFWMISPELNCYDRYFCQTGSKEFCGGTDLDKKDYLKHEDGTICYHETFVRHLFKVNEKQK